MDKSPITQISYADSLLELAEGDQKDLWLHRAYLIKANAYYYLGSTQKAYENYLYSYEVGQKGEIDQIYVVFIGLGNTFSLNKEPEKAIFYYQRAIQEMRDSSNLIDIGYIYLNIVDELQKTDHIDSIQYYLSRADSIFTHLKDNIGQAYVLGNRALVEAKRDNIKLAIQNLEFCIALLNESGSTYDIVAFRIELSRIFFQKGEIQLAQKIAQSAFEKAKESGLKVQIRDAAQLLTEIYRDQQNHEQALHYQTLYLNYKDSISNEETIRKMADLRTEFEVSQKQQEIDLLEKEQRIDRVILIAVGSVLLIVMLLGYFLYRNFRLIKAQRRDLVRQKSELQDLNRTKDKMFSIISHDLRGPVHSITGLSSMMHEFIEEDNREEILNMGEAMTSSLQNVSSLLDNLLEWASNQQGKIPYHPEYLSVSEVMESLHDIFLHSAEAKDLTLNLAIAEDMKVFADENTFRTIFRNLIGNAIKFSNPGDEITISAKETEDTIAFTVRDTGVGMPKEKVDKLFDLNVSQSTWGTQQEKGIGLGLRLAHEFTLLNRGSISVESQEGVGTEFIVTLPGSHIAE